MKENKWLIKLETSYKIEDQIIIRDTYISIPPTKGNRTDIIGRSGKYYYGLTKKEFNARMSKEDYLDEILPNLKGKLREKALKEITWTRKIIDDQIEVIIEITNGEITLKT